MVRRTQSPNYRTEARLRYVCMCFGWFQELIGETSVTDLSAAEAEILAMLDRGAMIVHVYRETDQEHPELVGRHSRLRSFNAGPSERTPPEAEGTHEIERFLLDAEKFQVWADALKRNAPMDQCWAVVDLWPLEQGESDCLYGRATLIQSARKNGFVRGPGGSSGGLLGTKCALGYV